MEDVQAAVRKEADLQTSPDTIIVAPLRQQKQDLPLGDLGKQAGQGEFSGPEWAASVPPHLAYFGGPLLTSVQVYTIFWGKHWATTPSLHTMMNSVNSFFKAILVSPLIDQLHEYSVPGLVIGHGSLTGTKAITAAAPTTSVTDAAIRAALIGWINAHTVPAPNANTLYFIYTEPKVSVIMGGGKSCTTFCGYHNYIPGGNAPVYYAVMPYPGCPGCLGGLTAFDALTGTSSHELCEAITDPKPGFGWYDTHNGEIGDICAWHFKHAAGYNVQLEWSNAHNACV